MYSVLPSFIIGFHGCDQSIAEKVLSGDIHLNPSTNSYDWLGHGIYFWENNPQRALDYANLIHQNPKRCVEKIETPAVVGAVIDLGHCFNLLDAKNLQHLRDVYNNVLCSAFEKLGKKMPENKPVTKDGELVLKHLDCAVIETAHHLQKRLVESGKAHYTFDTVRAVFMEGKELYENAGFREENHIQICVRNPNCIKGYFRAIKPDADYRIP